MSKKRKEEKGELKDVYDDHKEINIEELIQKRLEFIENLRTRRCIPETNIGGLPLKAGDIIKIRIRGFAREEIIAVFECFNEIFKWMKIKLDDSDMIVKLSEVRYIRKERVKDEKPS
jgi:hypothetical protein